MFALSLLCLNHLFLFVFGLGEISILQNPESIQFRGKELLDLSMVKNVISAAMGFTNPEGSRWTGMIVRDPFGFAEGAVIVAVQGVASLDSPEAFTFPLFTDENLDNTWDVLSRRISERFPNTNNLTMNYVSASNPERAGELYGPLELRNSTSLEYLDLNVTEDKAFIDQINTIDAIRTKIDGMVLTLDGLPDLHWISVSGLHDLVDIYGADSKQVQEAKHLLSSSLTYLSGAFDTAYNSQVIFAVLTSDVVHTRRFKRDESTTAPVKDSDEGDDDFAAMFNIFLWTGIAFVFVLLAVSVGIAQMDPGRDSIIYRMTSQRMKKDN